MDGSWAPKIHFYISIHPHEVHFVQIKWSVENSLIPIHHQFFLVNLSQYIFIFRCFPNCCCFPHFMVGNPPFFQRKIPPWPLSVERRQVLATLLLAGADPEHQSLIGSVASDLCSSEAGGETMMGL